jgi:ABC-type phosphate transport system substrate-binding protein
MKNLIIFLLLAAGIAVNEAKAQSYRVIVNEDNETTALTKENASRIFMKKTTAWKSGTKITVVDQSADSPVRKQFSLDIHGKALTAVKAYWQQQIFSGKGVPPAEKNGDSAVLEFVSNNPGAVGYVFGGIDLSGYKVKSIKITE